MTALRTLRPAVPMPVRAGAKRALRTYGAATASLRPLPDFLIIGAKRGGTTSLYHYLQQHPGIASPFPATAQIKGAHFFDTGYARGTSWYRSHFPTTAHRARMERRLGHPVVVGEGSPYYLFHPHAPARAAELVPHAKLILLLRHPVDRAYSHYKTRVRMKVETLAFADAIAAEPKRLAGELERMLADPGYHSMAHEHFSYLSQGLYLESIRRWLVHFPREQMWIGRSEDFYADPQSICNEVAGFLGLPPFILRETPRYQDTGGSSLDPALRQTLSEQVAEHNRQLSDFIGLDLGWDEPTVTGGVG
jgi:hypothetical protein